MIILVFLAATTHSWLTEGWNHIFLALFCHINAHRSCQWVITLNQGNKSKPWASLSVPPWSQLLGSGKRSLVSSTLSVRTPPPLPISPSTLPHMTPSEMKCSELCRRQKSSFDKFYRQFRCSFYPGVIQCSLKPFKRKETKNMFAKIKLKSSSEGDAAIYTHTSFLPRMFLM